MLLVALYLAELPLVATALSGAGTLGAAALYMLVALAVLVFAVAELGGPGIFDACRCSACRRGARWRKRPRGYMLVTLNLAELLLAAAEIGGPSIVSLPSYTCWSLMVALDLAELLLAAAELGGARILDIAVLYVLVA